MTTSFQANVAGIDRELLEEAPDSEINRNSPDYIRWIQQSLNQILGLRLAVDGNAGTATRSAIRSFQQQSGLAPDGMVGPKTEAAIRSALGAGPSAQARPPSINGPICVAAGQPSEVLRRFDFDSDSTSDD